MCKKQGSVLGATTRHATCYCNEERSERRAHTKEDEGRVVVVGSTGVKARVLGGEGRSRRPKRSGAQLTLRPRPAPRFRLAAADARDRTIHLRVHERGHIDDLMGSQKGFANPLVGHGDGRAK